MSDTKTKISLPEDVLSHEKIEYTENKYLSAKGLKRLWQIALNRFVLKRDGMGLSSNDFTNADKEKLNSLSEYKIPNATKDTIGGIKVGAGLTVSNDGTLSAVGGSGGVAESIHWDNIVDKPDFPDSAEDVNAVNISVLGQPNGVATLNEFGIIDESQIPFISDIEEGVMRDGKFYNTSNGMEIDTSSNTLYIDTDSNISYRWNGDKFVQITSADIIIITNDEIDKIIGGE